MSLDLKETKEVISFAQKVLDDLAASKNDDGKITTGEWLQAAITNAPSAVKAFMGIDRVDDELKDLDEAETKNLRLWELNLQKVF